MSTRARIGIQHDDGSVESIYTHWDGYPSHNGKILLAHYTTKERVLKLIALGDLSILNAEIGEKHDFDMHHDERHKLGPWCVAYGRDRGEDDVASKIHAINDWPDYGQEYEYLFQHDQWYIRDIYSALKEFVALTPELIDGSQ